MANASPAAFPRLVSMGRKRKVAYLLALAAMYGLTMIFGPVKNPFGQRFLQYTVPLIVLINSLQWFAISLKIRQQVVGAFCSFLAGLLCAFLYPRVGFPNFTAIIILGLFAQGATMWFLAADRGEKSIVVAQHLAIVFVVLVGTDLRAKGIAMHLSEVSLGTGAFLFWSPLFSAFLWASSVLWHQHTKETLIVIVCGVVQAGLGLSDLGTEWNVAWGFPCAVALWLAAAGLAVYLAKTWKVG